MSEPNPVAPAWRIDLAGWSREATQGDPREFLGLFQAAEQLGFDGVWFHEFRLLAEAGPYPSPLLLAAALLARTERLRVGTQALVLPLHDPQLLAEELAQLHFQSGGRFDAGVGRGTDPQTLQALGIAVSSTRERFEAGVDVLRARVPQVPLYAAGATRETLGFALSRDLPLLLSLEPPEGGQLAHAHDWLQGRASAALQRSSIARYVCVAADATGCKAILQPLWQKLQARRTHFALQRGVPPGDVPCIDPERMLREQFICGTPEQCFDQLQALRARTGLHHIRCVFNANGQLDNAQALAGMRLFAQQVLPALRQI
ncbi:MAG: LLM class flavin-dependent oxidoreductase [Comamonadaceae bacterium]|nr:MAG: LLM class flavin-dependent oxidoreductase [Comamonadaceae bacterium]